MSLLEIFGIVFLAVIALNVVIGVFAIKSAVASEEEADISVSYANNNLKMITHN